jgi:uncharacterized protein (TIGR00255 family)
MTGFARAEKTDGKFSVAVEIRTVNSRFLDIVFRVSPDFSTLEDKIRSMISEHLHRGRVELRIDIKAPVDDAVAYEVDMPKAKGFSDALLFLTQGLDLPTDIRLDHFLGIGGLIKPAEVERNLETKWEIISNCLKEALICLEKMREREGRFIAQDFKERISFIEEKLQDIKKSATELLPQYQERLKERIAILTKGVVGVDLARIAQEAAFLADRSDISEEIVRAESHLNQFRLLMQSDEPAGRNLNFLLQEFNREFNTMASKAGSAKVSHIIVSVKSELEKIREQVQNVE